MTNPLCRSWKHLFGPVAGLMIVSAMVHNAEGALITSSAQLPGLPEVIDFKQFGDSTFGPGPVQIGSVVEEDITWSAHSSDSRIIQRVGYKLGANGTWGSGRGGYTASFSASADVFMRYEFHDGPVGGVGGFVNYDPALGPFFVDALNAAGGVLESYEVSAVAPIATPSGRDDGGFRGIMRPDNDIFAFQVRGGGVLDDLSFGRHSSVSTVPEPSTLLLTLCGVAGTLLCRRHHFFRRPSGR